MTQAQEEFELTPPCFLSTLETINIPLMVAQIQWFFLTLPLHLVICIYVNHGQFPINGPTNNPSGIAGKSNSQVTGRAGLYRSEPAQCRIVMAKGQRPNGQSTCGVWPKSSLLCSTQVTRIRIYGGVV